MLANSSSSSAGMLLQALTRSMASLSMPTTSRSMTSSSGPLAPRGITTSLLSSHRPSFGFTSSSSPSLCYSHQQVRQKGTLGPRRTKYRKAHKGRVPIATGGSVKGTTVRMGQYGIRLLAPSRLTAKQLQSAETALKRKLKPIKGAQVFLRLFPDLPVCVKGNETRMGKGKGTFEFWAVRGRMGKVVFEIGGDTPIREEVAKEALRLASAKLPVPTEFVTSASPPRLGNLVLHDFPPRSVAGNPASVVTSPVV